MPNLDGVYCSQNCYRRVMQDVSFCTLYPLARKARVNLSSVLRQHLSRISVYIVVTVVVAVEDADLWCGFCGAVVVVHYM